MPNLVMATETIFQTFHQHWGDRTPVEWPNLATGDTKLNEGDQDWVGFDIFLDDGYTVAIGGKIRTYSGEAVVRIFVLAGKRGLEDATLLAKEACDAFDGKTIDGVRFMRVYPKTVGRDGTWFQINVRAEFEFDDQKP